MNMRLRRPTNLRLTLGKLTFVLAAVTLVWPMHIQAATGAEIRGVSDQYMLSDFVSRTCPWELHLGHVSTANLLPPRAGSTSRDILENYNNEACTAKRYDRTSEALLWMIVGALLTVSGIRRRFALTRLPQVTPVTA